MKTVLHPEYKTLFVYIAESAGDKAVAGAFYITKQTVPLSTIATGAYGNGQITATQRINKSAYNISHCIYRESASWCGSKIVDSSKALTAPKNFNPWAWVSLCNTDKNGQGNLGYGSLFSAQYQVIWIPTTDGKEPWDIELPETDPVEEAPVVVRPPSRYKMPEIPKGTVTLPGFSIHIGDDEPSPPAEEEKAPSDGGEPVEEETQKAGFPWWLGVLLGGGALITVIVFAVRDKKKGKKGKSK